MISVCMATFNGEKFLRKQLDSILSQLAADDEIIISDDGSTDDTLKIIASYNDARIKVYKHLQQTYLLKKKNSRNFYLAAANFENALKHANGDYIFLTDQDDIWKANKVITVMTYLKTNDIVMSNFSIINEADNVVVERYYTSSPISKSFFVNIAKSRFLGCCMAFKRCVLEYVLPFPKRLIGHDFWIGCLGVSRYEFAYIQEPLHFYRRATGNVSSATEKSNNSFLYKILYRTVFLLQCLKRLNKR